MLTFNSQHPHRSAGALFSVTSLAVAVLTGCANNGGGGGTTPGPTSPDTTAPPVGGPPSGLYVCQNTGTAEQVGLFNFELAGTGDYTPIIRDSKAGRWSYDDAEGTVTFESGSLAGAYEGMYVPANDPNGSGSETIFLREPGDTRSQLEAAHPACYHSEETPEPTINGGGPTGNLEAGPASGSYDCLTSGSGEPDELTLFEDGTYESAISDGVPGNWSYDPGSRAVFFDGPGFEDLQGTMVDEGPMAGREGPSLVIHNQGLAPTQDAIGQWWCQIGLLD